MLELFLTHKQCQYGPENVRFLLFILASRARILADNHSMLWFSCHINVNRAWKMFAFSFFILGFRERILVDNHYVMLRLFSATKTASIRPGKC